MAPVRRQELSGIDCDFDQNGGQPAVLKHVQVDSTNQP